MTKQFTDKPETIDLIFPREQWKNGFSGYKFMLIGPSSVDSPATASICFVNEDGTDGPVIERNLFRTAYEAASWLNKQMWSQKDLSYRSGIAPGI